MHAERLRTLLTNIVSIDASGAFEDLDSLRLIDIVEIVEGEFQLRITAAHVVPQNFASLDALSALIVRLRGGDP